MSRLALVLAVVVGAAAGCGSRSSGSAVAVPPEADWPDAAVLTPPPPSATPADAGPPADAAVD